MNEHDRSDEELAQRVAGGDEAAFAELYRRYFGRVYDFALRLARDRDVASLVVQSSFLGAYRGMRSGEMQAPFELQVFANAHHDVRERLRRRRGPVLEGEEVFASTHPAFLADAPLAPELPDLARDAWQASREMKPDEYELLDLSVRQSLDVQEMAAVLRMRPEVVEARAARVRDSFEESFSSLLLLRRGRRECLDLDFQVGQDEWSVSLRRRITRHLGGCDTCREMRRRFPAATEVFAALMLVPAPTGWEETILDRLQSAVRTGTGPAAAAPAAPVAAPAAPAATPVAPTVTPPPAGRPPGAVPVAAPGGAGIAGWFDRFFGGGDARGPMLAGLLGGIILVVIILAALCGAGAFDGGGPTATPTPTPTATGTATPTPTATATSTATPTLTSTPQPLPTATPAPPTSTPAPPTATTAPPTPAPATATPEPP